MKQMSLGGSGFERKTKRTRKREFLDEMNLVVPWAELVSLIAPHAPAPGAKGGRPPFAVETMLRIHFLQQWFNLSDPAMEEALYDMALFREFVGLDAGEDNLPDESTSKATRIATNLFMVLSLFRPELFLRLSFERRLVASVIFYQNVSITAVRLNEGANR